MAGMETRMKKEQILQIAVSKGLTKEQFGEEYKSAFGVVHGCMHSLNMMNLPEKDKKEKLIKNLQSYWRKGSKTVEGCKREVVQTIGSYVFGIRNETDSRLSSDISSLPFQDLYLYYCYIERLVTCNPYVSNLLFQHYKEKRIKVIEQNRKREELKKKLQQEEQQRELDEKSEEQKWENDIFEKHLDMGYYFQLVNGGIEAEDDKVMIAGLLKEYWKKIGKWEGKKVSEKQAKKIRMVNNILKG